MAKKKKQTTQPEIIKCFEIEINGHELQVDSWIYGSGQLLQVASKVYDRNELVAEYGPYECDGFHVVALYRGVNLIIEIARQILSEEIDRAARTQAFSLHHRSYGQHRVVNSRVFVEDTQIVWELAIGDDVQRSTETCEISEDGWRQMERAAFQAWRQAVLRQLQGFFTHLEPTDS